MRFFASAVTILCLLIAGCGKKNLDTTQITNGTGPGTLTAQQAGNVSYRFAYSAQVLSDSTQAAIPNFSVSLLAKDTAITSVINALGDTNGIFHISRNPGLADASSSLVPVLVSAPGFDPAVQMLDVGKDCQTADCTGAKPAPIYLQPIKQITTGLLTQVPFNPSKIAAATGSQSVNEVFNALVNSGKLDPSVASLLAGAQNGTVLQNILVTLNGSSSNQTANIVSGLLGSVDNSKLQGLGAVMGTAATLIPLIAAGNPGVGGAMVAVSAILPYLAPILTKITSNSNSGPLGQIIGAFVQDPNFQTNIMNLIAALGKKGNGAQGAQLAMGTFLPILSSFLTTGKASQNPFANVLGNLLKDPNLFNLIASGGKSAGSKNQELTLLTTYLQPLIQALANKNPQLAALFNQLVSQNGLLALKNFGQDPSQLTQFAALIPYLQPLVKGLNSSDAQALAKALVPLLSQKDPSAAIAALLGQLTKSASGTNTAAAQVLSSLAPALQGLVTGGVAGKQVFAAQLLQGLTNGIFQNLQVTKDVQGSPAVIVTGIASDIFKLAQLPNVSKVVALGQAGQ